MARQKPKGAFGISLRLVLLRQEEQFLNESSRTGGSRIYSRRSGGGHNGERRSAHHRKRCVDCNIKYPKSAKFCPACGSGNWRPTEH